MTAQRGRLKIKRRALTLDQIAAQMGDDFIAAIYSAIGNRTITDLYEGDRLDDVVEQALDRSGMADDLNRLSSTRMEIHVGLDVSMSMFDDRKGGRIVMGAMLERLLNKAFQYVTQSLPAYVFRANLWLWAAGRGSWYNDNNPYMGGQACWCLTDPGYGNPNSWRGRFSTSDVDDVLKIVGEKEPGWSGAGTFLAPLLAEIMRWELEQGSSNAHRLNIIITDGALHDTPACSIIQRDRGTSRLLCLLLNVGYYESSELIPEGFTQYHVELDKLADVVRDVVLAFVQSLA